ncbi:hypothetical protein NEOC84_000372|nr:hypothetical protein [Neochlamydia sp. AcF84]
MKISSMASLKAIGGGASKKTSWMPLLLPRVIIFSSLLVNFGASFSFGTVDKPGPQLSAYAKG